MADIINLRQARKSRARAEAARRADANRAKFGRTKAEKKAVQTDQEMLNKHIDGARLVPE